MLETTTEYEIETLPGFTEVDTNTQVGNLEIIYEIETLPGFTEDDVNTKVGNLEIVPLHPNDPLGTIIDR